MCLCVLCVCCLCVCVCVLPSINFCAFVSPESLSLLCPSRACRRTMDDGRLHTGGEAQGGSLQPRMVKCALRLCACLLGAVVCKLFVHVLVCLCVRLFALVLRSVVNKGCRLPARAPLLECLRRLTMRGLQASSSHPSARVPHESGHVGLRASSSRLATCVRCD